MTGRPGDGLTGLGLDLRPVRPDDAPALFPILTDPAMWWFDPAGRHADLERTSIYCTRAAARWDDDGLSYWTVRLAATGELVGSGGAQRHHDSWNLNYRIAVPFQGRGYAGALLAAAREAASETAPDRPQIAWIDEVNAPSRRVAKRGGLVEQGLRTTPADGVRRLAYADRVLDDDAYPPA